MTIIERPEDDIEYEDASPHRPYRTNVEAEVDRDRYDNGHRTSPMTHPLDRPQSRYQQRPNLPRADLPKRRFNIPDLPEVETPLPLPGVTPIGDSGWYITPDEPADPRDCNRYPNSVWCGENPWTLTPVGLEPTFVEDECAIGIRITPVLGFTQLPPIEIQYRKPECRGERKKPFEPPEPNKPKLHNEPNNIPYNALVKAFVTYDITQNAFTQINNYQETSTFKQKGTVDEVLCPGKPYEKVNNTGTGFVTVVSLSYMKGHGNTKSVLTSTDTSRNSNTNSTTFSLEYFEGQYPIRLEVKLDNQTIGFIYVHAPSNSQNFGLSTPRLYTGEWGLVRQYVLNECISNSNGYSYAYNGYSDVLSASAEATFEEVLDSSCKPYQKPKKPPPAPPPDCRCMRCCGDSSPNNDDDISELLREILKRVKAVEKRVWVGEQPVTVPKLLTDRTQGTQSIENLAVFNSYVIRQLDALLGKYPIEIEVQDADLTAPGEQKASLNLPNLAEAIAEIFGMMIAIRTDTDASLSTIVRTLIETGSIKQTVIATHDYAKGNAEYLNYKGKQYTERIPFSFTPGKSKLDEMLQHSDVEVKRWENDDKQDLTDYLQPLLEAAAITRAANWRKVPAGNIVSSLLDKLTKDSDLVDKLLVDKDMKLEEKPDNDDEKGKSWDGFLEEAEQGFRTKSGITDTDNPWGRDYERRPKIREIGKTDDAD